ncbi:MAG: hypothetical protein GY898_13895, partial [Proteobacteria bacterium]|nr:hypothetical protein [Pseudomonadota bacterium]
MTNFTRIAALATFATGIAFSAPDANASELGHIIIESADCKAADSGAFALGADSIDISTMCEQKGGAIVATWDNPGGDTAFEVWGMVAAADGSWTLDHQFTVYENKLVGDVSGPGLFSLFVRGLDTGYAADGGTALRYVDG